MAHQHGPPLPRALAVVPARLGSLRLPGKMLLAETGAPLVVETARNALGSGVFERLVVAADSPEVLDAARRDGIQALNTDPDHPSGTDRVREALELLGQQDVDVVVDVVVNVQGDEPELSAADLESLVRAFLDPKVELASLWCPLDPADAGDPSAVKVVLDRDGDALYFSRSPIPALGHGQSRAAHVSPWKRHVGVYAYRPAALKRFCALPQGELEVLERLEQLRWLEHGGSIRMVRAHHPTCGIDTASDYAAYVERARRRGPNPQSQQDDT